MWFILGEQKNSSPARSFKIKVTAVMKKLGCDYDTSSYRLIKVIFVVPSWKFHLGRDDMFA